MIEPVGASAGATPSPVLAPIDEHAMALMAILVRWPGHQDWSLVADWLSIVGSLNSVSLNSGKLNPDFGWCSQADAFDAAREDLLTAFVRDLTMFSFCWGALEAALNVMALDRFGEPSKRGKIQTACAFIAEHFESHAVVEGLEGQVARFRAAAIECLNAESVERRFRVGATFGAQAVGLFAVYELRNHFAHGSLNFPLPDDANKAVSEHSAMIDSASRIALLQLQMLLLAYSRESTGEVSSIGYHLPALDEEFGEVDIPLNVALRRCHLGFQESVN